ncbi:hypothetical protein QP162_00080 [Sphingomonas aurantiaca]|uniref:hypothetical protein n=1 Tax=Sphingomonas aurantiaca TaxID=185949 RepID=UPI002FDFB087
MSRGQLADLASGRLIQSDDVLTVGGFEKVADILTGKRNPRIAVIGGSTSALTTIALLLKRQPGLPLGAGAITLLHRRPLRPFYHSVEAAHAEGFTDFGPDDICPVSGFVYRLAGFRLEARDLVLRMLRVDGRAPDPRGGAAPDRGRRRRRRADDHRRGGPGHRGARLSTDRGADRRPRRAADPACRAGRETDGRSPLPDRRWRRRTDCGTIRAWPRCGVRPLGPAWRRAKFLGPSQWLVAMAE